MSTATLPLVSVLVSVVALGAASFALLRAPGTRGGDPADLASLREEVAELRRSVDITRSQTSGPSGFADVAELERRLAALEGRPPIVPVSSASRQPTPDPAPADAPAPTPVVAPAPSEKPVPSFTSPHPSVSVEAGPGGRMVVRNSDPTLTGQKMTVYGIDPDGKITESTITVPAPG